jgi:hypothetical protein
MKAKLHLTQYIWLIVGAIFSQTIAGSSPNLGSPKISGLHFA